MRIPKQFNLAPIVEDPLWPDWFRAFVQRHAQQGKHIASSLPGPQAFAIAALGATPSVSLRPGDLITATVTANTTITLLTDQRAGAEGLLELTQNATGGWTVAWVNVVWTNSTPPVIAAGIGKKTLCGFTFNGVAWVGRVLASSY